MIKFKNYIKLDRNILIMYLGSVIGGMLFFLPILGLYYEKELFTVTNVALIFAIESLAGMAFEIPSGAVSDLFGRKKTLILSLLMAILGLIPLYIGGSIYMFILYAVINSLAMSLTSGTDTAIIYDTLKEKGKESEFKKILGIMHAFWPLGASIASIIGGYVATAYSLKATVLLSFVPMLVVFILYFFLREPVYHKEKEKYIFRHIVKSFKFVVNNTQLLLIIIGSAVLWSFSESLHFLNPIFFEFNSIPIEYFGIILAATYGLSSLGFYLSHRVSIIFGNKISLIVSALLFSTLLLFATLSSGIWLVSLWTLSALFFGIRNPIITDIVNLEIESGHRATVNSIDAFTGKLGVAITIPVIGYIADAVNINFSFRMAIIGMFVSLILFFFLRSDKKKN